MNADDPSPGHDITAALLTLQRLGPSAYAIALHIRHNTPLYLFQTYSDAFSESYARDGLFLTDPSPVWGMANAGWIRWSDLAPLDHAAYFARARAAGLPFGLTIAVGRGGTRSIATLTRDDREVSDPEAVEAEEAVRTLHDATHPDADLDPAQREVLRRLSEAFTRHR